MGHLVLPDDISGSGKEFKNLMDQYRPCYRAGEYPEVDCRITVDEY